MIKEYKIGTIYNCQYHLHIRYEYIHKYHSQKALTLSLPTTEDLVSSTSSTSSRGWLDSNSGVKFPLNYITKLLRNPNHILIDLLVIVEHCKLHIVLFQEPAKVLVQHHIYLSVIVPEWRATLAWLCEKVLVLHAEIHESVSARNQPLCPLDCYSQLFPLVYCERV